MIREKFPKPVREVSLYRDHELKLLEKMIAIVDQLITDELRELEINNTVHLQRISEEKITQYILEKSILQTKIENKNYNPIISNVEFNPHEVALNTLKEHADFILHSVRTFRFRKGKKLCIHLDKKTIGVSAKNIKEKEYLAKFNGFEFEFKIIENKCLIIYQIM